MQLQQLPTLFPAAWQGALHTQQAPEQQSLRLADALWCTGARGGMIWQVPATTVGR